ncbi:MAG TPA: DEAD/DEAH box helicase [Candidatus Saccharimonadales bacterium]|nr:DEAD/DEAH box helicase [Candidatus Saccharimonadales bacterium]
MLYVSPLKALSNDIHKNLEEPLAGLRAALLAETGREIDIRAEVRTGDTPAAKRQAIARKPPHILVTTPESFYLLLTSDSGRRVLRTVRTLIVDEIHAVVGNRRGSHLALSMERLAALVPARLQRIGLSATQKPIEEVARFLVGDCAPAAQNGPASACTILDFGYARQMDLAIELPGSPLEAVMSNEVWAEVYGRMADLIAAHRTTLVFVNTRRLAERVTHQLGERLGQDKVASHHGSLSAKLRLDAEHRLKNGELKALVATASLELGIDIGSVDLVCQVGPTRSLATFLQRAGRAEHRRGGLPKARLFPLSRDELVETAATLRSIRHGELDSLILPDKPLDLLAQQIVAAAACEDWEEGKLFDLMRSAYPYRGLERAEFDAVLHMLADGFSTRRGRRGALLHHDAVNGRVRARRGARLVALTSGGAIPDNADYRVILEPGETFLGTVNEDFAVESMAGEVFQLGNASWRILRIQSGVMRVEDARGQPPSMPFWLGEAPGRTAEVSQAVSALRREAEQQLEAARSAGLSGPEATEQFLARWLEKETDVTGAGARQLAAYFAAGARALGVIPSQSTLVLERFFDESGGMQLVLHSPFGIRVNRAWGLALRKRFCRSFNFELQAAATDDAIVLSLGTQHSFPLEEVFRYLHRGSVRDLLVQALLDAPMFPVRWRWNASRALALPRQRGGRRIPAPLQRMEAENLLAAVFPDQLACLENIAGDRVVPDHPLVRQTIEDCLTEAMDLGGLMEVLRRIEAGEVQCVARDLPEPSPFAHEILQAKPYAFLDNAPLEERRTQAVYTRRAGDAAAGGELGVLDAAAIDTVTAEAWPRAANADEIHEALLVSGLLTGEELARVAGDAPAWLEALAAERRAGRLAGPRPFWVATERWPLVRAVYPEATVTPVLPAAGLAWQANWEREAAVRELVRGRMEICGPITARALSELFLLPAGEIDAALLALEGEGFLLRGRFRPAAQELEWCDRRLLARIHRLTLHRLRAEIQPVSAAELCRFLLAWQRVAPAHQVEGPEGLEAVLEMLDGYEVAAGAWEPEVLALRVKHYSPLWLDQLCFTGRIGWGRLTPPQNQKGRPFAPVRSSPMSIFTRAHLAQWLALTEGTPGRPTFDGAFAPPEVSELEHRGAGAELGPETLLVRTALEQGGALFFEELVQRTRLLPSRIEQALAELTAQGWVTADSFEGLRALLVPPEKRTAFAPTERRRRNRIVTGVEQAGRWSLLQRQAGLASAEGDGRREAAVEVFARVLLRRYGVVFRRMLEREAFGVSWFELGRVYRRMEARGEIRGGHFVGGMSGEQFALPEAIGMLRSMRRSPGAGELVAVSGVDPLNLAGILTPGPRVAAIAANRLLLRDGVPIAALQAGSVVKLAAEAEAGAPAVERALRIGTLPVALRPYYA